MTGLYIHIPFCKKKCRYCDFYSICAGDALWGKYTDAIISDIKKYARIYSDKKFDTLFVGGGTPTVIGNKLCDIIYTALNSFDFMPDSEITAEANPESLTLPLLKDLKSAGVNRISLGVQSFDNEQLKIIGRIHDADRAKRAIYDIKESGIDNFNIDLMFALPYYSTKSSVFISKWQNTLDTALGFSPTHISAYSLTLEKNTPLMRMTDLSYPTEDEEDEMYDILCEKMSDNGYAHYEISNYAKSGYECRHNLKYWSQQEYLGLGPGAHSFIDDKRFAFKKELSGYLSKENFPEIIQNITPQEYLKEKIMTGLRTNRGVRYSDLTEYYNNEKLKNFVKLLRQNELAHETDNGFYLTEKGYRVSNTIINTVFTFKKD